MAAEEVAKFRIDGDSFTFCGGSGVEQIDEESQSLIGGILKNLTIGGDAGKLLVPTFFLEPRSMLEKMTDLFAHPQLFTAYVFGVIWPYCRSVSKVDSKPRLWLFVPC